MTEITVNRRRSQRLYFQVAVLVEGQKSGKPKFAEKATTVVLNAHGALVEMGVALDHGQIVTLQNARTNEKIECVVKLVTPADGGKFNTALEFTKPNPGFWHVSFPPEDWTMRHPDAKKGG